MSKFILIFCTLLAPIHILATTRAAADSAYMRGDYSQAVVLYDSLLASGHNATLYHNQGNAYYRLEQYPKAILAYERGLRYAPADDELARSLILAKSKVPEAQPSTTPFFVVTWYKQALLSLSVVQWTIAACVSLALALALLLLYLLARPIAWRKIGFTGSCVALLCCVWSIWASFALRSYLANHPTAIVMQRTRIATSPSTHTTATAYVAAGTKVEVTDRSLEGYWRVTLPDGKSMWIQSRDLAAI